MRDDTMLFYFGCIRESGHYLWSNKDRRERDVDCTPWGLKIDGKLCPDGDPWGKPGQVEGVATIHHKNGWTALAFWDRSVDRRPGSNSVFLAEEILNFEAMVEFAKHRFPTVWERFKFEVTAAPLISKFKVGDTVERVSGGEWFGMNEGDIGTVTEVKPTANNWCQIRLAEYDGGYSDFRFRLANHIADAGKMVAE